eukprot:11641256-Karenia_brevis.AAC.1
MHVISTGAAKAASRLWLHAGLDVISFSAAILTSSGVGRNAISFSAAMTVGRLWRHAGVDVISFSAAITTRSRVGQN